MIDWRLVGASALWIVGLAIVLAAFSYVDFLATRTSRLRRELFRLRVWRLPFSLGMVLVTLGMGLMPGLRWWERSIWLALLPWFAWQAYAAARDHHGRH
jgi:hypothetical protein